MAPLAPLGHAYVLVATSSLEDEKSGLKGLK